MNASGFFSVLRDRDFGAIGLALLLLLLAVFSPQVELPRRTFDYLVVFDLTQSMDVQDYELDGSPVSRLTFAREAMRAVLPALPCGSRIGWGAFAEYRTVVLLAPIEVCTHYNDLLASLDEIDGHMRWNNASEITKGVFWALRSARDVGGDPSILLFTDGHEAPPLDATRPAVPIFDDIQLGATRGWLIGVGGDAPRPIPRSDDEGNPLGYWRASQVIQRAADPATGIAASSHEHLSELREAHLKSLAQQVGFEYQRLTDFDSLKPAFRNPTFAKRTPVATDIAWLPASAALLVLALRYRPGKKRVWLRRRQNNP